MAAAIERTYAASIDEQRVVLAQHYLHAGRSDLAFPHLLHAAQRAQTRYANSEALALYRQALAIAPQHDQTTERLDTQIAALYENLGDILTLTGDYPAARGNYEWLLRVGVEGDALTRTLRKAALQRKVGGTHERQGNLQPALAWFERAAETIHAAAAGAATDLEHARVLSDIGWFHYRHDDLEQARRFLEQALALATPHEVHDELARLLNRLGGIAMGRGDVAKAKHYVDLSRTASQRSGSLVDEANALNNLGILSETQGRYDEAVHYGMQAMELYERVGNRRDLAIGAVTVGHVFYNAERYDEAQRFFLQALERAGEMRESYVQMVALLDLAFVHTALHRWDEAESTIQRCQFLAAQMRLENVQADCWALLAEVALGRGDAQAAILAHHEARALEIDPESEEFGRLQRIEAKLALLESSRERADMLLRSAEALFERLQNVPEMRRTKRLRDSLDTNAPSGGYARAI